MVWLFFDSLFWITFAFVKKLFKSKKFILAFLVMLVALMFFILSFWR